MQHQSDQQHQSFPPPPPEILAQVWDSPCYPFPHAVKQQGRNKDTWEAAAEPGEIHATLGMGVNENECWEKESISTPSTGPLTLHQLTSYTTEEQIEEEGFTYKHLCMQILSMCQRNPSLLRAKKEFAQDFYFDFI